MPVLSGITYQTVTLTYMQKASVRSRLFMSQSLEGGQLSLGEGSQAGPCGRVLNCGSGVF